jgi:acyl-CoA dehydrogenase
MIDESALGWPFFEESHRRLARRFGEWAAAELGSFESDEGGDGRAAREIFQRLGRGGWLASSLPQERGEASSQRLDLRAACLLREILGYSSAIADVAFSEPWLAILPIALFGSERQRRTWVTGYVEGQRLPAFALSEPGAGSDAAAIEMVARADGGSYVLDGLKTWTSNSGLADSYVVFARTAAVGAASGISAFVVDGGQAGIRLEERLSVLSPHTVGTLRFHDVRVPADALVGELGQGLSIALAALELFRPTVGAATLGFGRRALAAALGRSLERVAFRKPIAEHQLIQAKLADMAVELDAAALLVYRAAWAHDVTGRGIAREAAMAKLYATEAAQEVIDQAVQIFGGLGVVNETTVARLYRHVRAFRIFDGTSEIQKLIIAKDLLRGRAAPES